MRDLGADSATIREIFRMRPGPARQRGDLAAERSGRVVEQVRSAGDSEFIDRVAPPVAALAGYSLGLFVGWLIWSRSRRRSEGGR